MPVLDQYVRGLPTVYDEPIVICKNIPPDVTPRRWREKPRFLPVLTKRELEQRRLEQYATHWLHIRGIDGEGNTIP